MDIVKIKSVTFNSMMLLMITLLVLLGFWQQQRARSKAELEQRYKIFTQTTAKPSADHWENLQRVQLRGRFLKQTILLANQFYQHRLGYHVLTLFRPEGHHTLLAIDRGWLARDQLSKLTPLSDQPVTVTGVLYKPERPRLLLGANQTTAKQWPREMQRFAAQSVAQELQQPVADLRLILAPQQTGSLQYSPPAIALSSVRHQAYAWQFFTLALLCTIALSATRVRLR